MFATHGDQGLPLFVVKHWARLACRALRDVNLYTLALDHHKTSVDSLDLCNQLLLRNRSGLGLFDLDFGLVRLERPWLE